MTCTGPDPPARRLRVGVVGHRNDRLGAGELPRLRARVGEVFDRLEATVDGTGQGRAASVGFSVTSALAEGADRIGALEAVSRGWRLECPLPFERSEYERDFDSEESRREFRQLLETADTVWELAGSRGDAPGAYAAVGEAVLAHSDLLVAIWDGEDARGRGGTAEVVLAAAERMPVVWIRTEREAGIDLLIRGESGRVETRPGSDLAARVAALADATRGGQGGEPA